MPYLKHYLTSKKLWFTLAIALPLFMALDAFLPSLSGGMSFMVKLGCIVIIGLLYDAIAWSMTSSKGKTAG